MGPSASSMAADDRDRTPIDGVGLMTMDEIRFHIRRLIDFRLSAPLNGPDRRLWDRLVARELDLLREASAPDA